MHVASTSIDKLLDYVMNTPEDAGRTELCAKQRIEMINNNLGILKEQFPDINI